LTGFVHDQAQNDNSLLKITVNEYVGSGSSGNKFPIKCRYLKSDSRIDAKVSKTRKNSNVMIVGELILLDTEFVVEIQDLNFLPISMANIESTLSSGNDQYSWPATRSSGRVSAQDMARANTTRNPDESRDSDNSMTDE
jgi:hypothetical protein